MLSFDSLPIRSVIREIVYYPYHYNNAITIVRVLKGAIKIRILSEEYSLLKDSIIVINPKQVVYYEYLTINNEVSITYIDVDFCTNIVEGAGEIILLCNSEKFKDVMRPKYEFLKRQYDKMICERDYNSVKEFIIFLYKEFDYLTHGIHNNRFNDKIVSRYKDIFSIMMPIEDNSQKQTLKYIAEKLDISYVHLKKDIKVRYGHGYKWLRHAAMVETACRLLMDSDESIMNIAVRCGFSDTKYLIKYFKIFYNNTPSKFRRMYCERNRSDTTKFRGELTISEKIQ